jgi:hypothetical protein
MRYHDEFQLCIAREGPATKGRQSLADPCRHPGLLRSLTGVDALPRIPLQIRSFTRFVSCGTRVNMYTASSGSARGSMVPCTASPAEGSVSFSSTVRCVIHRDEYKAACWSALGGLPLSGAVSRRQCGHVGSSVGMAAEG